MHDDAPHDPAFATASSNSRTTTLRSPPACLQSPMRTAEFTAHATPFCTGEPLPTPPDLGRSGRLCPAWLLCPKGPCSYVVAT